MIRLRIRECLIRFNWTQKRNALLDIPKLQARFPDAPSLLCLDRGQHLHLLTYDLAQKLSATLNCSLEELGVVVEYRPVWRVTDDPAYKTKAKKQKSFEELNPNILSMRLYDPYKIK